MLLDNRVAEPGKVLDPRWLGPQLQDRTMRGIALGTGALIRSGEIPVGTGLPPVRELALELGVSPATISAAWAELRRHRVIQGRGRTGIWVCGNQVTPHPHRFERAGHFDDQAIDLTMAAPDPALLPPLQEALAAGAGAAALNSYQRVLILDSLRDAVAPSWCYRPEAYLATNGGYEAVHATLQALVMPGAVVAVEDPSAARLLDILDQIGAQVVPVPSDAEGPMPERLAEVLQRRPVVFLYQPRTHSTTGRVVTPGRLAEMARLLRGSETLIVEDDGVGDLATIPAQGLGAALPARTVHIRSFSKALGPDLRLAVLSGTAELVGRIQAYRNFGAGWTSRILQEVVAWLLMQNSTERIVDTARRTYAARRQALITAASRHGTALPNSDGLCVWVPVQSEQFSLVTMAAHGIAVQPGSRCAVSIQPHIRIATTRLSEHVEKVAAVIALVHADRSTASVQDRYFQV